MLRQDALVSISSWWSQICAEVGNLQFNMMPVVGMYFPKTIKAAYIYIDTYMYVYIEIGVQKLHLYSSSILSWVYNHQALFKPQGGVSKPSCAPLQKIKRVLHAHRHIGPSNPYVQKIQCLFIYLFRGFFLMGTSITIRRGTSSRVFFCAKKNKAWSCGCSNIRLNSWKSIKPSPAETFNKTQDKKNIVIGSPWKPKNKNMQTSEEQFSPSVLHLLVGSGFFVVLFLRLAPRVCIKILSDSDLIVVFK